MASGRWCAWLAAVAVVASVAWAPTAQAFVYWSDEGPDTLGRANLDGSGAQPRFIAGASTPTAVAVDGDHVYWANFGTDAIGRSNLDGSGADQAFITGAARPYGVAADGGHVYWANQSTGTIGRANLDGSGADQSFITGVDLPRRVAVDAGHVYWGDDGTNAIGRANLDGSGVDHSFITVPGPAGLVGPSGVAVDDEHIYWPAGLAIGRANLDGTGVDASFITGLPEIPSGVAVDRRHVYWAHPFLRTIGRANLDGSGANASFIVVGGASLPNAVAVDAGPAGSASASPASVAFGTQPLGELGAPQPVTVTNTGHGDLVTGAARLAGADAGDFQISGDGCSASTLGPGEACTLEVRFGPGASGNRQASLELTSNDPVSPLQVPLLGSGATAPSSGLVGVLTPAALGPLARPAASGRPRGPMIANLRFGGRCVRPTSAGRVRLTLSLRQTLPGPVQIRLDRVVGTKAVRSCPKPRVGRPAVRPPAVRSPSPPRRFRTVATLKRVPRRAAGPTAVSRLTLDRRLAPALYRITVRAYLDGGGLSRPVRGYLRVLGR